MNYLIAAVLLLFLSFLGWMYFHHHRKTREGRARLLHLCADLLDSPVISLNDAGFAELRGNYRSFRVRMTLEEDHAVLRKIPSLWLHLHLEGAIAPHIGTLDILVRPQNTEFYSPSWYWDGVVIPLPEWPSHALYRTKDAPPDLNLIDEPVRALFSDQKAKELLLTPHQLRLTYQAKQADRGEYLLLRSAVFDHEPLAPGVVESLLNQAAGMRKILEETP